MADINYNENWIGYTLGFSQANIERIAAGSGVPWRFLAARVGALLQSSEGGPIMGPPGGMPQLRGETREIGSEDLGREVPQSRSVAVAGNASGQVRRVTPHSNANGKLKPKPGLLLLQFLTDNGKARIGEAIKSIQDSHPKIKTNAVRSAVERYFKTGNIKRAADGAITITASGKNLLNNNGVRTMSAESKHRISVAQKRRYKAKNAAPAAPPEPGSLKQTLREFMSTVTTPLTPKQVSIRFKAAYPNVKFNPQQLRNSLYWSARGGHIFRSKGGGYSVGRDNGNGNQLQTKLNEIFPTHGRKAPTRDLVMSVVRGANGPLKRVDVVKLVHKQYPKLTPKSIHNALENGSRKGFFRRSDAGYTIGKAETKLRSLAAAA